MPGAAPIRALVVDDYETWRHFFSTTLQRRPGLQVIGEVSDGLEAVRKARQLQPELILLDIGLPKMKGIEAARRIREVAPASKILFVSENRSPEIAEEALSTGAGGYVVKSDSNKELLPAVEAVLQGKRFVSASLAAHALLERTDENGNLQRNEAVNPVRRQRKIRHEVEFYADDAGLVDGFARFIEAAWREGNAVIVVASDLHHASLFERLTGNGANVTAEIEQGNYLPLEVTEILSSFMVNNSPDPVLFRKAAGNLITEAAKRINGRHRRLAACGEGVHRLLAAGNLDATIALERLWTEIAENYQIDILCGYFRSDFATDGKISMLEGVCAEHSAAYGRDLD